MGNPIAYSPALAAQEINKPEKSFVRKAKFLSEVMHYEMICIHFVLKLTMHL